MPPRFVTTIRDSLYDRIQLSRADVALIETPEFLRLDRIQQLGFVSKVWPGAKHTRFEHSLGVFELMRQAVTTLRCRTDGQFIDDESMRAVLAASLLHDIGHYPFSHAIEELGPPIRTHEEVGRDIIVNGAVALVLESMWQVSPERVAAFLFPTGSEGEVDRLLRGLLSGALDVDKLDYLPRDARHCNVPYGGVDTPRLIDALRITEVEGAPRIVISDKGVGSLYSLITARQEMFDNVYWHHTNRACMVMLLRAVQDALTAGAIDADGLTLHDDASLMALLSGPDMPASTRTLIDRLQGRRLHKRAIELSPRAGDLFEHLDRLYIDPARRREVEIEMTESLAEVLGTDVEPFEILIDIPKPERWRTDVWVLSERPPVGLRRLMPFNELVGLDDDDLKRYEHHRRLIRIVTTERLRDEVARRWEQLVVPLQGGFV